MTLEHTRSCANLANRDEKCTCGLQWRIELQTEREMHQAWRKRAEEAEVALQKQSGKLSRYFVSEYTDGPATRWNVIDRQTQEWLRRFPTQAEAQQHADKLNEGK